MRGRLGGLLILRRAVLLGAGIRLAFSLVAAAPAATMAALALTL
jgi:hypothetical protein